MEQIVRVALDAMGGDNAPAEIIKGAVEAVNLHPELRVTLVGREEVITDMLKAYQYKEEQIAIVNATEEISCDEPPVEAYWSAERSWSAASAAWSAHRSHR